MPLGKINKYGIDCFQEKNSVKHLAILSGDYWKRWVSHKMTECTVQPTLIKRIFPAERAFTFFGLFSFKQMSHQG